MLVLLFGCLLLQVPPLLTFELVRTRFSWAHYWRPWLAYLATVFGTGLLVFWGIFVFSNLTNPVFQPQRPAREIRCRLDSATAARTVQGCLAQRGYEIDKRQLFVFDTVPKGDTVAELGLASYRKSHGGWRLGWSGARRTAPLLDLQLLSSVKPAETIITLNPETGGLLSREGAAEWVAAADALATAATNADSSAGAGIEQSESKEQETSGGTGRSTTTNAGGLEVSASLGQNLIAPGRYESTTIEKPEQPWAWQKTRLLIIRGNTGKVWRTGLNGLAGITVAVLKDPAGNTALQIVDDPTNAIPAGPFLYRIVQFTTDGFILDNGETLKRQP